MMVLLFALAALEPAEGIQPTPEAIRKERFSTSTRVPIPSEIFQEIKPYLDCMSGHLNTQLRAMDGATDAEFPQVRKVVLESCQDIRVSAKAAAVRGLGGTQIRRSDRPEFVERTLLSLEDQLLSPPPTQGLPQ